jgi:hypothetical protein
MVTKRLFVRLSSVLGVLVLMLSLVQPAYAAPVDFSKSGAAPAMSSHRQGQLSGFTFRTNRLADTLNNDSGLVWNTFVGGSSDDSGNSIAVDSSGNVYVTGNSHTTWGTPVRAYGGDYDAFVAKFSADGTLLWNTFLGGSAFDSGYDIVLDGSGNVFVSGTSDATWGSPLHGTKNGFIAKLSSSGALLWNTFPGVACTGIALNGDSIFVTGGNSVARLNSSGSLVWSTTPLGTGTAISIAVDGSGNSYVTGESSATWGTPVRAFVSGGNNAFVAKVNPGGALTWNTFLGGGYSDSGSGIAVDGSGNVMVSGESNEAWGTPIRAFVHTSDAFVAKLNPSGALTWNTFLGGGGEESGRGLALDDNGNIYISGFGAVSWGNPQQPPHGSGDVFVARLNSAGILQANTFLGGSGIDIGNNLTVDGSGTIFVTGWSDATWGSPLRAYAGGGEDALVAKVNLVVPPGAATLVSPLVTITTTHTPTYIWSKVADATYYRLWVKNSGGTWVMQTLYYGANICGSTNCAVTPATSLDNGVYTWYIQTLTATQNGTWSGHGFTVAMPVPGASTLVSPKGTIHSAKPTFIWSRDSVATLYRLWIKDSGGNWVLQNLYAGINICGSTNCAIVSPVTLANGAYTWYIQTLTATQNGQWSGQPITVSVPDGLPSPSSNDGGVK